MLSFEPASMTIIEDGEFYSVARVRPSSLQQRQPSLAIKEASAGEELPVTPHLLVPRLFCIDAQG